MKIWVDADACPAVIKDILFRAAERARVMLTLVANQPLRTPPSPWIRAIQVPRGFDVADNRIVQEAEPGDLVITADVPLAAEVLAKGAQALDPRGEAWSNETIREKLAFRDLMDSMRDTLHAGGHHGGGPPPLGQAERRKFAAELDKRLAARAK